MLLTITLVQFKAQHYKQQIISSRCFRLANSHSIQINEMHGVVNHYVCCEKDMACSSNRKLIF